MKATKVYEDHWRGTTSDAVQYETNDPAAGVKAVDSLDGKVKTMVTFEHDRTMLSISGGNDGRYMAFFAVNVDEELFNLVNGGIASGPANLEIVTGGQHGLVSARACLNLKAVEQAAAYFIETGTMNPKLDWERAA